MAISRNSTAAGTDDSSSFNITIGGLHVIAFVTYDNSKTLSASTLAGVSGSILQTANIASEGYKVSAVSYIGTFSGSQAVAFTWTGGTPTNIRSDFLGYNESRLVDVSSSDASTGGSTSATVTASGCWIVGYAGVAVGAGASYPTTSTNNDGYVRTTGTTNGLLRNVIGDSAATVSTGSQSVSTSTTGGFTFGKILVAIAPSNSYTITAAQGSFSWSGFAATLSQGFHYTMAAAYTTFSLTGQSITATVHNFTQWVTAITKSSTTWVNTSKDSGITPTNATKNTISPTNQSKN